MGLPRGFAAAIDGVFQRGDDGLHFHGLLEVARLDGVPQVDDELRDEGGEADQGAIDALHHGGEQVFVVAGEDGFGGIGLADGLDVAGVFVHVALAHLEGLQVGQLREVGEQLRRVGGARPGGIDVADEVGLRRGLMDRLEVLQRMAGGEAEAQPVVRGHHVERDGAGRHGGAGMVGGVFQALADDGGDDGAATLEFVRHDAGDFRALGRGEREHLARVAVGHDGDHAVVTREPGGELAQGGLVDAVVRREGARNGGDDAAIIRDGRHVGCLRGSGMVPCWIVGWKEGERSG